MTSGRHKPGYRKPGINEKRRVRRLFKIDAMPAEVREQIKQLRAEGKNWRQISDATGIPRTSLQRWWAVRIEQPRREIEIEALELAYSRGMLQPPTERS